MANSLVKGEKKQTFSVFLTQDAIKKKINEVIGGKGGQRFMNGRPVRSHQLPSVAGVRFHVHPQLRISGRSAEPFSLSAAGTVLHGTVQKEG